MLTKEELPDCPVATTVQLIGKQMEIVDFAKSSCSARGGLTN